MADDRRARFFNDKTLQCADYPTAVDAIRHYLDGIGAGEPDVVCLAAAGPVVDDAIRLTNNDWTLSVGELERSFGAGHVRLLNDFAAIGCAVPFLGAEHLLKIGAPGLLPLEGRDYTIGVIGPGTGLGCVLMYG
jgi:glucokinase